MDDAVIIGCITKLGESRVKQIIRCIDPVLSTMDSAQVELAPCAYTCALVRVLKALFAPATQFFGPTASHPPHVETVRKLRCVVA